MVDFLAGVFFAFFNKSKYKFSRKISEENILALRRELTSTLSDSQIFSEISINDKFKIFDSLIQKAYFKHCSKKN